MRAIGIGSSESFRSIMAFRNSKRAVNMSRILITNGYVVTVDSQRSVWPGGFVAIEGRNIGAVGRAAETPPAKGFEAVIDARGCIVLPGLINMHQHHWYTLFKGLADGLLLEDWLYQIVFPITPYLSAEVMRTASYLCGMEMLATGTTCSLNHSVTVTTPEIVRAS